MNRTLFTNCKLWHSDGSFDEAFGVDGDLIDFTGSNNEAGQLKGSYDEVIELGDKLVLPALTDGHLHLVYGSLMRKRLDCREVKSPDELHKAVIDYASKNKESNWIIGSNLNIPYVFTNIQHESNLVESLSTERPLFIANYDYHSAICNTQALKQSGLMEKLDNFTDELVPRNNKGLPIGIIKEEALNFVFGNLPKPSVEERASAVKEFIRLLHSYGITTVTDITLQEDLEVYRTLYEKGELNIRINSYILFDEFPNLNKHRKYTETIDNPYFTINGFKAFYDGALGSSSGLFSMNYKGSTSAGIRTELAQSGRLKELAMQIDSAGEQMIIHAIGDLAVTEVLDLYEELIKTNGTRDRRLRIEHAQHINKRDLDRFKALDVIVSAQPIHLKYDMKLVYDKLPDELINTTHNYKLLIDRGVPVVFGTDFPIVEVNPFENIQAAVTRKTDGMEFTPEFGIPVHECIKAYTINNAYSNFNDNAAGTITKGKVADFVIMEDNLFEMDLDKISEARVYKTYLAGKQVYSL